VGSSRWCGWAIGPALIEERGVTAINDLTRGASRRETGNPPGRSVTVFEIGLTRSSNGKNRIKRGISD